MKKTRIKIAACGDKSCDREFLPLLISSNGDIYVDYRSDFAHILKNTKQKLKPGENIQDVYWQETPFVPAFSVPYTINKKGEPAFLEKKTS